MNEIYDMALADNGRDVLYTGESSIHGRGLFVNEPVPADTILCRRLGLRAPLSLRDKRAIIGIDGLDPATADDVIFKTINHSCSPNALLNDTGCLISIELLTDGEEVTVDYEMLLSGSDWQQACQCELPGCRKIIKAVKPFEN